MRKQLSAWNYYPTHRQSSLAVRLVIDALRSKCA
jgi:hypothetical protein